MTDSIPVAGGSGGGASRRLRFLMLNWRDPENPLAGGAERVSLAFLRGLVGRGHEVDWFSFAFPGGAPEGVLDGIRLHRAGVLARRFSRRSDGIADKRGSTW